MIGRHGILTVKKMLKLGVSKQAIREKIGCTREVLDEVIEGLDKLAEAKRKASNAVPIHQREYECWEWGEEKSQVGIIADRLNESQEYLPTREEIEAHCKRFLELCPREPVGCPGPVELNDPEPLVFGASQL
jgi:hypothetical protein